MNYKTDDLRIESIKAVTTPLEVCKEIPITEQAAKTTALTRSAIHDILDRKDNRLIVIAGPCSIHDVEAAEEYASKLKSLIDKYSDDLLIIMRVYFEKPRTTVGWKGLINDPSLDNSFNINKGLRLARQLLLDLNEMGVPAGTEYLDLITPQYVTDLISWGAIGARTTESQVHRELASGLSCPVGFKNGTYGTTKIAVDAINAATRPHHFLSIRKDGGNAAIVSTKGNVDTHIILRGGKVPNYEASHVKEATELLTDNSLPKNIVIDCSHGNSNKDHKKQPIVFENIINQRINGNKNIVGVMIESHINAGNQKLNNPADLDYGVSITDACVDWNTTEKILLDAHKKLSK